MIDKRFFDSLGPLSLADLAARTGARLADPSLADRQIDLVAPLAQARSNAISFAIDARRLAELQGSRAGACFLTPAMASHGPDGCAVLITDRPHLAWVVAANALHAPRHATDNVSAIHATARLEPGVYIGPGVVIGPDASIGAGTRIEAGAVIGRGVTLGRDCHIGPHVSIAFAMVGDQVRIGAGCRLGEPGFGATSGPNGPVDVPQLGRLIIQNGVSTGTNCTIDRGAWDDTVIGENSKLDNQVHIAHNVRIGRNCLIAGQVGISGSTVVGDGVAFGGQAGVADHLTIGDGASIGASGGVLKDIPAREVWSGTPARPVKQWLRETATLSRMSKKTGGTRGRTE